jgi:beta-phosphoglucomutase-like phosphatase (HAD superfamily)
LGLQNCFPVVVTGEDVLLGKPDAAVYRLACNRLGIDPEHLLAVEDAISGVRAAVAAGLRCVGVALHETPKNLTAAGAVHVLRDFEAVSVHELESILLRRVDPISHQAAAASIS